MVFNNFPLQKLSKDVLNYDDVITKGQAAVLRKYVMPTRNIPVVLGHKVVRFSHEFGADTAAAIGNIVPKSEPGEVEEKDEEAEVEDDDGSSLLQEMAGTASNADKSAGLVLADPRHLEHIEPSHNHDGEFTRICRACLSKDNTLVSVFEDGMDDVFFQFTTITIDVSEGISTLICDECKSRLLELQFFRESCVNNTQILVRRFQNYYGGEPPAPGNEMDGMMCDYSSDLVNDSGSNGLQQELNFNDPEGLLLPQQEVNMNDPEGLLIPQQEVNMDDPEGLLIPQHEVSMDDPEDLLMPQKEVLETDLWEPKEQRPKPKQVLSQPVIKPPVVGGSATPAKRQSVVKKRYTCRFCRKEYSSKVGIDMHMVRIMYFFV